MKLYKSKIHLISDYDYYLWNIEQTEPKFLDAMRAGDIEKSHKCEKELAEYYSKFMTAAT